jgi:hypothetical protein
MLSGRTHRPVLIDGVLVTHDQQRAQRLVIGHHEQAPRTPAATTSTEQRATVSAVVCRRRLPSLVRRHVSLRSPARKPGIADPSPDPRRHRHGTPTRRCVASRNRPSPRFPTSVHILSTSDNSHTRLDSERCCSPVVPRAGFEPAPTCVEGGLSPPCLPIPPPGRSVCCVARIGLATSADRPTGGSISRV